MKNHEFEHFRKAPHPYQQFGDLPPMALKNRSIKLDYGSLPQGENAFHGRMGKKISDEKYKSSIKNSLFFDQSLNQAMSKHGKSLQTRDIEGAQGGSLKSQAVKYKQKAQKIKNKNKQVYFDRNEYEQLNYKNNIQNAIKFNHSNDRQIAKFITQKGNGHIQYSQRPSNKYNIKDNKNELSQKQLYQDQKKINYSTKNKEYDRFFNDFNSKQEKYKRFFNNISGELSPQYSIESIGGNDNNFSTIQFQNNKYSNNPIKEYQQKNYAKNSIQNQFKQEGNQKLNIFNIQLQRPRQKNTNHINPEQYKINLQKISKFSRKFNPTNLSTSIGPSNSICQLYS